MHIELTYREKELGQAWDVTFAPAHNVAVVEADITTTACSAVVSPANSFGFMDGGLDAALSDRFGWDLQKKVQATIADRPLAELLVGEALVVETGDDSTPWLIVAPTMRVPMSFNIASQ